MDLNTEDLRNFLITANKAGYAADDTRGWTKEADGSLTILHSENELTYHDNFFGGDPFGGRIAVSQKAKPKWIMVYYGWVNPEINANHVFQFLRSALKKMPQNIPLRGPSAFKENNMEYFNQWSGDLTRYSGNEVITQSGEKIYECSYLGGWVDSRSAL